MTIKVAINGFGRIGRTTFKALIEKKDVEVVAINDLTDNETLVHLLKYDSAYGTFDHKMHASSHHIYVDGKKITALSEKDPLNLPWKELGVDVVIESTGIFRTKEKAGMHLKAGASAVVISAPGQGDDVPTYLIGINAEKTKKGEKVVNMGSCTTNCIAPVAAVIEAAFGIKKAFISTIHGYTADQNLVDGPHKDLRRARAAAVNIVPTSTGAAIAVTEAIPSLKGKFDGMAFRVPVLTGSATDFVFLLKKNTTAEEVNAVLTKASKLPLYKGVLEVTTEEIVSSDIIGNPHSSIVDLSLTKVIDGDFVKIVAWYDNEWGYSQRLAEYAIMLGRKMRS